MKTHYYTCPCCGFKNLKNGFNSLEICIICYWEDDDVSYAFPYMWWWPNNSLVDEQKKALKKVPENIKEYNGFFRDENWKPLKIENIKFRDKPYIEKWFYESQIVPIRWDTYYERFLEAQKYNPSDN
jgi:hypothetical protein